MRDLRPSRLIELASGLWAVDDVQPVAAVLDPLTGDVRRIVSWRELPPAPPGGSGARVLGDGTSLWTQQTADGPLLRVGLDGVATAAWTGGLMLAACGPGVAWCAPDRASHGVPDAGQPGAPTPTMRYHDGGRLYNHWYDATSDPDDPDVEPVAALGLRWHLGWSHQSGDRQPRQSRRVEASAHDSHGMVRHWDLGEGTILAAAPAGAWLAVAVARSRRTGPQGPEPVDVLALNPAQSRVIVLLPPASIDISSQCWPLVPRPLDADSYAAQVLASNDDIEHCWHGPDGIAPLAGGLSQAPTSLVGDWPETHLEWTFAFEGYPGVRLRRRVALFDELGRATEPEYAAIHLMEDLDTLALPLAAAAHDGVLDI